MRIFTWRNALLGWLVALWVRKRLVRRLNALAGNTRTSRRLL